MQEPAVIVLLVHDAESRLKRLVERVFEATEEVLRRASVIIVDDGSSDDTYEVANELAVVYPQLHVLRQTRQAGLGPALKRVRSRVSADRAIVYDGTSPLAPGNLASMLQEPTPSDQVPGSPRFAAVRELNDALEQVHRPLTAFRWLPLDCDGQPAGREPGSHAPLPAEAFAANDPIAVW